MGMCDKKEEKEMDAVTKKRPVESTEIDFASDKAYEDFVNLVNNPPEPNDRAGKIMKQYRNRIENPGWKRIKCISSSRS